MLSFFRNRRRFPVSKRRSMRLFKRTANKFHVRNRATRLPRGGFRV